MKCSLVLIRYRYNSGFPSGNQVESNNLLEFMLLTQAVKLSSQVCEAEKRWHPVGGSEIIVVVLMIRIKTQKLHLLLCFLAKK